MFMSVLGVCALVIEDKCCSQLCLFFMPIVTIADVQLVIPEHMKTTNITFFMQNKSFLFFFKKSIRTDAV